MAEESMTTRIEVVGAEEGKRTLIDFFREYKTGEADVKSLNTAMKEQAGTIYGARRALMLIRTEWRMQHAAWIEGARLMRDIGRIGRNITQMWQAYTIGIIRVEKAQSDLRTATKDVGEAQERYNRYLEVFGEDSVYTIDALNDLEDALDTQKEAQDRVKKASDDMAIGIFGITLQAADLIATIPMMVMHIHMVKETLTAAHITATTLATSLGVIGATLGGFAAGAIVATTLADAFGAMGAQAAIIIGSLTALLAVLAAIALNISIISFGGAAVAGLAAFGVAMAAVGAYELATMPEGMGVSPEELERKRRHPRARQFGGAIFDTGWYYLHRGEEVLAAPIARMRGRGERGVTIRQVRINQYFGDVHSEVVLEHAGVASYRALMRKLDRK